MDWNWETMRAHYLRVLQAALDRDLTQGQIAVAGGLKKEQQNYISKIKNTPMKHGPAAEIFIRLIAGLGPVSDFFAALEGRPQHRREHQGEAGTSPSSDPPDHHPDRIAIVKAIIDTLQRGVTAPTRTARRRRRKKKA